jgi:hypothetical protein
VEYLRNAFNSPLNRHNGCCVSGESGTTSNNDNSCDTTSITTGSALRFLDDTAPNVDGNNCCGKSGMSVIAALSNASVYRKQYMIHMIYHSLVADNYSAKQHSPILYTIVYEQMHR